MYNIWFREPYLLFHSLTVTYMLIYLLYVSVSIHVLVWHTNKQNTNIDRLFIYCLIHIHMLYRSHTHTRTQICKWSSTHSLHTNLVKFLSCCYIFNILRFSLWCWESQYTMNWIQLYESMTSILLLLLLLLWFVTCAAIHYRFPTRNLLNLHWTTPYLHQSNVRWVSCVFTAKTFLSNHRESCLCNAHTNSTSIYSVSRAVELNDVNINTNRCETADSTWTTNTVLFSTSICLHLCRLHLNRLFPFDANCMNINELNSIESCAMTMLHI